jgi:hypothetical protein
MSYKMTREEVIAKWLDMPDHQRDAWVAESVMGLKLEDIPEKCPECGGYVCQKRDRGWCGVCCRYLQEPEEYSTDLLAAMTVFDKLRNSDKYCCLTIYSDYHYCWKIALTKAHDLHYKEPDYKHEPSVVVDGQDELPEAICLAALIAAETIE